MRFPVKEYIPFHCGLTTNVLYMNNKSSETAPITSFTMTRNTDVLAKCYLCFNTNNLIKIRLNTYVIRFYSNIIVKTELV